MSCFQKKSIATAEKLAEIKIVLVLPESDLLIYTCPKSFLSLS